jgi:putative PIG3 family NAD(P)H quinone oxidoreductase
MLAVIAANGEVVVAEKPDPEPGPGEVLVRVRGAGLNGADLLQVAGKYPPPPDAPQDILGMELAGEVVARGPGVSRFSVGNHVMAIVSGGAQAELCVVPELQAMDVPNSIDFTRAGGFPEVFTTAHDAIVTRCGLRSSERLLVHGAAGGVGTAAVQLGAALGAEVTATVRDPALHKQVKKLGAKVVLSPEEFSASAGDLEFDVILELVGGPNMPANIDALADHGRIVVIGIGAGPKAEVALHKLMGKYGSIHGSTLRRRSVAEKGATARALERQVVPLLAAGDVIVPVTESFELQDAPAAYERFANGGKLGKLVLTN